MARARNIKPGFFTNDALAECGPLGQLLFAGLWTIADREGRLRDRPKKIKAEVLPYYDCDADWLLGLLEGFGFIQRYQVAGDHFIQIVNWSKHQSPHIKEAPSEIPAPCEHGARTIQAPDEHEERIPDTGYRIPDTGLRTASTAHTPAREKPPPSLYAEILNGSLPKLESMFQGIDQLFTPAWLAKELADAAAVIGPLSREQLGRGLDIAVKQIERQMAAKTVRNPRPFAHKLIVDYLTEQRDEHHAA